MYDDVTIVALFVLIVRVGLYLCMLALALHEVTCFAQGRPHYQVTGLVVAS